MSQPSESTEQKVVSEKFVDDWLNQDSHNRPWVMCEVDEVFRQTHTADLRETFDLTCENVEQ